MRFLILVLIGVLLVAAVLIDRMVSMPGRSSVSPLEALPLELFPVKARLENDVRYLAEVIGERHYRNEGSLERTAQYLEGRLANLGYSVRVQAYGPGQPHPFKNLEVEIRGGKRPDEIVVIGAHYDTVPGSPGADDNATGIAALLELARDFSGKKPKRTIRFVAFVNEEEPFATTPAMGSMVYARAAREHGDRIMAMVSLESIGFYSDEPGSQNYPVPLRWLYPDTGIFLAFVGNFASCGLVRDAIASFRAQAQLPSEGLAIPEALVKDIGRSDHASFWRYGYSALMVTDTAPFRNPNYHSEDDKADTLDFERFTLAVLGLRRVVEDLAGAAD
jgi:hypothetical protein